MTKYSPPSLNKGEIPHRTTDQLMDSEPFSEKSSTSTNQRKGKHKEKEYNKIHITTYNIRSMTHNEKISGLRGLKENQKVWDYQKLKEE